MHPSTLFIIALLFFARMVSAEEFEVETKEKIVYSKVGDRELLLDVYQPKQVKRKEQEAQKEDQKEEATEPKKDESNKDEPKKAEPKKDEPNNESKLSPAILIVHGGAWRSGNRRQLRPYAQALTKRGYVCFAIDYRLAPKHKFPAQIEDCRMAVQWIREHAEEYEIDPQRLGAIGYSAGGHLVSLLGTTGEKPSKENGKADTRLQVIAAGGAPTDFRWFPDNGKWAKYWMGGDLGEVPEKFKAASAAAFVDKDDPPIFFFNGTADKVVPMDWTKRCYEALKKAGVRTEMHLVKDAKHIPAARDAEALSKAYKFLDSELLKN